VLIYGHTAWLSHHGVGGFFTFLETLSEGSIIDSQAALIIGMHAFRMAFIIALIVLVVDTVKGIYQLVKRQISPQITIPLPVDKSKNSG
jgi:hypothetical protein